MERKDIMPEYRGIMQRGLQTVQAAAKHPDMDQEKTRKALEEYEWLSRIIDAMTPKEQDWPLDMDFARLHEIAQLAGASDKFLLVFLRNFYDLGKTMGKMERRKKS